MPSCKPPATISSGSGLTGLERGVFLRRLKEEHPEFFPRQFSEEKWREVLACKLQKEANRFMAAAASL